MLGEVVEPRLARLGHASPLEPARADGGDRLGDVVREPGRIGVGVREPGQARGLVRLEHLEPRRREEPEDAGDEERPQRRASRPRWSQRTPARKRTAAAPPRTRAPCRGRAGGRRADRRGAERDRGRDRFATGRAAGAARRGSLRSRGRRAPFRTRTAGTGSGRARSSASSRGSPRRRRTRTPSARSRRRTRRASGAGRDDGGIRIATISPIPPIAAAKPCRTTK